MQLHNIKRTHKNKKARIIGRAGQRGKTSGRGTKGQNARAGHKKRPEIRDFIKRVPKLRGRGKNLNTSIKTKPYVVNLDAIEKVFKDGDVVNTETIIRAGLVGASGSAKIKILGTGNISKKLTVKGCSLSASAKSAIEKAGGNIIS